MPEIIANYKALIQYNSVFSVAPLDLPTLGLSANGRIHYEEVKRIFAVFQIVLIASVAGLVPLIVHLLRLGKVKFLKMGGMVSAILAIAILLYLGLDWKRFFVRFHETLFDNDFWIFDAAVDPSILILPNGYFMVCAVMIFALIFGLSATAVLLSRSLSRRNAILQGR
jgi:integral membrane protein (TIGR01906 family)